MKNIATNISILYLSLAFCVFSPNQLFAQKKIDHQVFAVGNLMDISDINAYTKKLEILFNQTEGSFTLLALGDQINSLEDLERMKKILFLVENYENAKVLMIDGDREWDNSGENGWQRVTAHQRDLEALNLKNTHWLNQNGCPGPELYTISKDLVVLAINTQWWNHPYEKPQDESSICEQANEEEVFDEIAEIIDEHDDTNMIIVGHFPLSSNTKVDGKFSLSDWILPVPIFSAFATAFHQNIGDPEDLSNQRFAGLKKRITNLLSEHQSLVYLTSHAPAIEISEFNQNYLINSGAAQNHEKVRKDQEALFQGSWAGLVGLNYKKNGSVSAQVFAGATTDFETVQEIKLFQSACLDIEGSTPINTRMIPCLAEFDVLDNMTDQHAPSLRVAGGPEYSANKWKQRWLGKHYRESWLAEVEIPILNLDTTKGGLRPYAIGGGRQSKSLKIKGGDGREYVFRSVNKDPSKALEFDLRETIISLLLRDQTTTQQPYGALSVARLLDSLDILHAKPELYIMPNDGKLGPFRDGFANMIGMLEEKPIKPKNIEVSFAGADKVQRTVPLFQELYKDLDISIDKEEFIRARVFDILVGDWGKHEDNWKWAGYKDGGKTVYRPVPRDRDHVFSLWDGWLPYLADREWAKASGENFDYRLRGLRSLMWQARHLDRLLASESDLADWLEATAYIQNQLSDKLIDDAIKQMPLEVAENQGIVIAAKLKARRADLTKYATQYYKMLAREVDIVGSLKNEAFTVERKNDGSVDVIVSELTKKGNQEEQYRRTFLPTETKEIRLFGLDGDDQFFVNGTSDKSPLIRIIPGPGQDLIDDQSKVAGRKKSTLLYDLTTTEKPDNSSEVKLMNVPNQDAYNYRRTAFQYDTYFPWAFVSYSVDFGVSLNLGTSFTNYKYGKSTFSSNHTFSGRLSSISNGRFSYVGKWKERLGRWDIDAFGLLEHFKSFRYFFGRGNDTEIDQALFADDYYNGRYTTIQGGIGTTCEFLDKSMVSFMASFERNGKQKLTNNIFEDQPDLFGNDAANILKFGGLIDLDFRDRANLPEKGMRFLAEYYRGFPVHLSGLPSYGSGIATIEYFGTAKPITLGIKAGFVNQSENTPYYDLYFLGQNSFLRGFRRNRFTGDGLTFINSDIRIELSDKTKSGSVVPYKFGIKAFYDMGRVHEEANESTNIHAGYGAGIYFVPLKERFAISISVAFSEEESGLLLFSLGSSF